MREHPGDGPIPWLSRSNGEYIAVLHAILSCCCRNIVCACHPVASVIQVYLGVVYGERIELRRCRFSGVTGLMVDEDTWPELLLSSSRLTSFVPPCRDPTKDFECEGDGDCDDDNVDGIHEQSSAMLRSSSSSTGIHPIICNLSLCCFDCDPDLLSLQLNKAAGCQLCYLAFG